MVCSFKVKERRFQQKLDFSGRKKNHIIYKNPFYYAIISIFQAFTVWHLKNETFQQSESLTFILWGKENRESNLLTTYDFSKREGKKIIKKMSRGWSLNYGSLQKASCYPACYSSASCFSCLLYSSCWFLLKSYQLLLAMKPSRSKEEMTQMSVHWSS